MYPPECRPSHIHRCNGPSFHDTLQSCIIILIILFIVIIIIVIFQSCFIIIVTGFVVIIIIFTYPSVHKVSSSTSSPSSYSPIHPSIRNVKLVESKDDPFQVLRVLHSVDEVPTDYQRLKSEDYDDDDDNDNHDIDDDFHKLQWYHDSDKVEDGGKDTMTLTEVTYVMNDFFT